MLTSKAVEFEFAATVLAGFAWSVAVSRNARLALAPVGRLDRLGGEVAGRIRLDGPLHCAVDGDVDEAAGREAAAAELDRLPADLVAHLVGRGHVARLDRRQGGRVRGAREQEQGGDGGAEQAGEHARSIHREA